jgi:hypothetical protein
MKSIFSASPLLAALLLSGFAVTAAGCGGGGGSSPAPVAPNNLAPSSISGHTLTFVDPDQSQFTTAYVFSSATYTSPNGDSGSYTYAPVTSTTTQATLKLVSTFSPALTYNLTFTSSSGGTYVNQVSKSGTFTIQ